MVDGLETAISFKSFGVGVPYGAVPIRHPAGVHAAALTSLVICLPNCHRAFSSVPIFV
jgi:hypothetical protein